MRNLHKVLLAVLLVSAQVASSVPITATDSVRTLNARAEGSAPYNMSLSTATAAGIAVNSKGSTDFDRDVLDPLRVAQAQRAEQERKAREKAEAERQARLAAAQKAQASTKAVYGEATGDNWYRLRLCESGNNYANKRNATYRGAYQFSYSTWNNFGGYYDPADAPPGVQDEAAKLLQARRGWSPWPACARKLGLL